MKTLAFDASGSAVWETRPAVTIAAACVVANEMRAVLERLFGHPVRVRLLAPQVPVDAAWRTLLRGAFIDAFCGVARTAAIVVRPGDAHALAALAFEDLPAEGTLSRLERHVVERVANAAGEVLGGICGSGVRRCAPPAAYFTYFELLLGERAPARLGIAIGGDSAMSAPAATLDLSHLAAVEVDVHVELAGGEAPASMLLGLRPGDVVPMTTRIGDAGVLRLAGAVLARGQCGANGSRLALVVQ